MYMYASCVCVRADYKVSRFLFRSEYAVQADGSLMPLRYREHTHTSHAHTGVRHIVVYHSIRSNTHTHTRYPFTK